MVLLTAEEARRVSGETTPGHALVPVGTNDGRFILSLAVLHDPAHAKHIPFLLTRRRAIIRVGEHPEVVKEYDPTPEQIGPRKYNPPIGKNPWDVPPLPKVGDWSESALYEAIGRALSAWERFEHQYAMLFQSILSPSIFSLPAERAYGSIATFRGRSDMVRSAGEALFAGYPDKDREKRFTDIVKLANNFCARRNEIAHGIVGPYERPPERTVLGLALMPPDYATNKHDLVPHVDARRERSTPLVLPRYAYTAAEVSYFEVQFRALIEPTYTLDSEIYRFFEEDIER